MNTCMNNEKDQLLLDIGTISFVLVDLCLYLDTHPHDREALDYFHHYSRIRKEMLHEFSSKYYPLTLDSAECGREWDWGLAPAPWEGGC